MGPREKGTPSTSVGIYHVGKGGRYVYFLNGGYMSDSTREDFEKEFPVPFYLIWDEKHGKYVSIDGLAGVHRIAEYNILWMGFKSGAKRLCENLNSEPVAYGLADYATGKWDGDMGALIHPEEVHGYNHEALTPLYKAPTPAAMPEVVLTTLDRVYVGLCFALSNPQEPEIRRDIKKARSDLRDAITIAKAMVHKSPNCGACPGNGTVCSKTCKLESESPQILETVNVPIEPTTEMLRAAQIADMYHGDFEEWLEINGADLIRLYSVMLSAVPAQLEEQN